MKARMNKQTKHSALQKAEICPAVLASVGFTQKYFFVCVVIIIKQQN